MSLHPRDSVRTVPRHVSFFLRHLHHDCSMKMFSDQLAPRVDAQASAERTGIGGWFLHVDQSGQTDVKASRWFSLEITRDEWPRVFEMSSKPALIISTLEALAVLVALKVCYGGEPRRNRSSIRIVPTTTDNRGNGAALNKLMTTRYPASAVGEWVDLSVHSGAPYPSQPSAAPVVSAHAGLAYGREAEDAHQTAKAAGLPARNQKRRRSGPLVIASGSGFHVHPNGHHHAHADRPGRLFPMSHLFPCGCVWWIGEVFRCSVLWLLWLQPRSSYLGVFFFKKKKRFVVVFVQPGVEEFSHLPIGVPK